MSDLPGWTAALDPRSEDADRRLLAAIAAALLGGQGSPVWSRTGELLLLSSRDVQWHHERAAHELDEILPHDA